jgi:ubiquinone/menaquinone biosynthesis C-methylase UbiE
MRLQLKKEINGLILDIGGGGEGVISQVYPGQVIAIDNRKDELEETPDNAVKIIMDASKMAFTDKCFNNITAFYSFMYISKSEHSNVISEIVRVLKPNGQLHIWDAEIKEANPFITDLDIEIDERFLHTSYGVYKDDAFQDADYFKKVIIEQGLFLVKENNISGHIYQCWQKD